MCYSITPNIFVRHVYVSLHMSRGCYALLIQLYTLAEALGWGLGLYYWRPGGTKDRPTYFYFCHLINASQLATLHWQLSDISFDIHVLYFIALFLDEHVCASCQATFSSIHIIFLYTIIKLPSPTIALCVFL